MFVSTDGDLGLEQSLLRFHSSSDVQELILHGVMKTGSKIITVLRPVAKLVLL